MTPREFKRRNPRIATLVPDVDLQTLVGPDGNLDAGMVAHLHHYAVTEMPHPEEESATWVQEAVRANPGTWTARLCRARHGRPETRASIVHCGLCREYANPRKRQRAARRPDETLPGFEEIGGAYKLYEPCSDKGLRWMRYALSRLRDRDEVESRRERRPDVCQPRGWDLMTTYYPT